MTMTFTILGCGNSAGTPSIGNQWGVCDPAEPKNRRTRPAAMVQTDTTTLVIDTGPDFKEQANRHDVSKVDAVFYTHAHADHISGVEELRVLRLRHQKLIPIYGNRPTIDELRQRFDYLFFERHTIYPQVLEPHIIEPQEMHESMTIGDITFTPFIQDHGTCESIGLRFGDVAYSTDMLNLSQQALEVLIGCKIWVVDAAAYKMEHNYVHANLKKIFEYNQVIQAEQVYLTHMPSFMDYATLCAELPDGYKPAHDGLTLRI